MTPPTAPAEPGPASVIATGRSIDVEVRADPDACARSAAQLGSLAGACDAAARLTAQHAQIGEEQLGGLSGIVYRHSSTLLSEGCGRTGRRSRRLADGLVAYADGLRDVRRRLDEVVAVAAPHLTVAGGRVWSPAWPPDPADARLIRAWAAWHDAVDRWRRARELQQAAEQAWLRVLDRPLPVDDGSAGPAPGDAPAEGGSVGGVLP